MSYARRMASLRVWPIVLGLVGGCTTQSTYYPPGGGDDTGWSPPSSSGGGGYYGCRQASDCQSFGQQYVCARDGECIDSTDARLVRIGWTLKTATPDATTCAAQPTLALTFTDTSTGEWTGFAPVPCSEGKFTIDIFPKRFDQVMLSPAWGIDGPSTEFTADGTAMLDLPY